MRLARFTIVCCLVAAPASAQLSNLALQGTLVFYGDDTEFSNPFRTGETLIGTFGTLFIEANVSDRVQLQAGGFGHWRFGSSAAVDLARPHLAIVIRNGASRFIFGTLDTSQFMRNPGPDRAGPHGLLPPIQRDTLTLDRAYEAGMQWTIDTARFAQDAWLNWQRLNTENEREIFDAGWSTLTRLRPALAVRGDVHIVHRGGQHGGSEPVSDSSAAAAGLVASGRIGKVDLLTFEINALGSRFVPDREQPDLSRWGFGTFVRLAVEEGPWRSHAILWRGDDFVKVEGDALYQSQFRDGLRYEGVRDYFELGLARRFAITPQSFLEAAVRFHRTEDNYEFSFRITTVARFRTK
jgi:hypothetical protein